MLLILTAIASAGHSQKTDTVCMPKADAKAKLKQLEDCKVDQLELRQKREENSQLLTRIAGQSISIADLEKQVAVKSAELVNRDLQISNREQKLSEKEAELKEAKAETRKQKRGKVKAWIVTGVVTAGAVYLLTQ